MTAEEQGATMMTTEVCWHQHRDIDSGIQNHWQTFHACLMSDTVQYCSACGGFISSCLKYPTPAIGGLFYGVSSGSRLGKASNTRSENNNLYLETNKYSSTPPFSKKAFGRSYLALHVRAGSSELLTLILKLKFIYSLATLYSIATFFNCSC